MWLFNMLGSLWFWIALAIIIYLAGKRSSLEERIRELEGKSSSADKKDASQSYAQEAVSRSENIASENIEETFAPPEKKGSYYDNLPLP